MTTATERADWLLYEHDDGRRAVAPSAEAATFAHGEPAWHRVGPVEVHGVTLPQAPFSPPKRGVEVLRNAIALLREEACYRDDEGEDTDALDDLLAWLTPLGVAPSDGGKQK